MQTKVGVMGKYQVHFKNLHLFIFSQRLPPANELNRKPTKNSPKNYQRLVNKYPKIQKLPERFPLHFPSDCSEPRPTFSATAGTPTLAAASSLLHTFASRNPRGEGLGREVEKL